MVQNLPPASPEQRQRKMESMLAQHAEDIKRLWRRLDLFPMGHFGDLPHGEDPYGTTSSTSTTGTTGTTGTTSSTSSTSGTTAAPCYLRPDGDVSIGSWTDQAGGTTNLYATLDEASADDSDYVKLEDSDSTCEFSLTNEADPGVHTGHVVRIRFRDPITPGDSNPAITMYVYQGTTQIAGWFLASAFTGWATIERTLSEAQAANITDYSDLRIRLVSSSMGTGDELNVSWLEMEIPCA